MRSSSRAGRIGRMAPLLVALAVAAATLVAHRGELRWRVDLNDGALHAPIAGRMADAITRGENPLDCWMSEWTLGHPVPRTYQPLGHLVVATSYLGLGGNVPLPSVFTFWRWLLLGAWPLAFYAGARLLGLDRWSCAGAALAAPLVATEGLYGLEAGSYAWRGSGLFTQQWATVLMPLAIGLGWRALAHGRGAVRAAVLLALTFAAHLAYGWMAAITLVVASLVLALPRGGRGAAGSARWRPLARLATLGVVTAGLAAWLLVPIVVDRDVVNRSRWEAAWKWDSFGMGRVLELVATGEMLDFGRFRSISILALAGVAGIVLGRRLGTRHGRAPLAQRFVLVAASTWVLLFAGRPAWDGWLDLLGARDLPLHRLIGAVHLFLVLLAGIGVGTIVRVAARAAARFAIARGHAGASAAAVVLACLAPAAVERLAWIEVGNGWARDNLAAHAAERGAIDAAVASARDAGGRAYSGLAGHWGGDFKVSWTPFHAFLSRARVPTVSFLYHAMALTSDVMVQFDESRPEHHRLFAIRTVIAPEGQALPDFLVERSRHGRFRVLDVPGSTGWFDVVDVIGRADATRATFYDVSHAWMLGGGPASGEHLWLALASQPPAHLTTFDVQAASLTDRPRADLGGVVDEHRNGESYEATVDVREGDAVLFKQTFHPGWRATVDGAPAETAHVTPGFVAVPVGPGRHVVRLEYRAGALKSALLVLAPLVLIGAVLGARAGGFAALEARGSRLVASLAAACARRPRLVRAAGLAGVTLLAALPLMGAGMPAGHDHASYPARVVEFVENLRAGVPWPRWAPDLGSGHGQPLFVFAPPVLHVLGAAGWLVTGNLGDGLDLAIACVLLAGAWGARRLAGGLVGSAVAGWVAAVAWVLAPYVLVDVYVRSALAETCAIAFYAIALDGFARHARTGSGRPLALGGAAVALVALSHPPAALLFAPLAVAWIAFLAWRARSVRQVGVHAVALAAGLALAATAWLPALALKREVKIERLLEGYLRYENHFVVPWQLLWSRWGGGLSLQGTDDGMSFRLGVVQVLLALAACAWGLSRPARRFNPEAGGSGPGLTPSEAPASHDPGSVRSAADDPGLTPSEAPASNDPGSVRSAADDPGAWGLSRPARRFNPEAGATGPGLTPDETPASHDPGSVRSAADDPGAWGLSRPARRFNPEAGGSGPGLTPSEAPASHDPGSLRSAADDPGAWGLSRPARRFNPEAGGSGPGLTPGEAPAPHDPGSIRSAADDPGAWGLSRPARRLNPEAGATGPGLTPGEALASHDPGSVRSAIAFFALTALAWSLLACTWSKPLWDALPLLQHVEFPWRALGVVALALAVLAGAAAAALARAFGTRAAWLAVAALVVTCVPLAHPLASSVVDDASWTPDRIARDSVSVTTAEEYAPRTAPEGGEPPWEEDEHARVVAGEATVHALAASPTRLDLHVDASTPSTLDLRPHAWPGWRVKGHVAGHWRVAPESGLVRVDVPAGAGTVSLRLGLLPSEIAALALTAVGALGLLALATHPLSRRRKNGEDRA